MWGQEEQNQLREHQGKRNIGSKGHSGQNVKTGSWRYDRFMKMILHQNILFMFKTTLSSGCSGCSSCFTISLKDTVVFW